jgi:peptidyl-dipeptidase A
MTDDKKTKDMLDRFDSRFREIALREGEASFSMYRGLEHEDLNKIEAELSAIWSEPETLAIADAQSSDPALARPLELVGLGVLRNKVEGRQEIFTAKNECNQMIVDFKPEVDGQQISRSDLNELMRWEKDAGKRKRAAAAFVPLEETLHDKVLSLIETRNAAARELGFRSYPHLAFHLNELDLDEVRRQLESLMKKGADGFRATLDEYRDRPEMTSAGLLSSDLAFMHDNYLPNLPRERFQSDKLIDALKTAYRRVGIDLDSLPIETVIQDIPAGGFCFTMDPGRDVRILANPRDGQTWYQVLFHEYGHAVQGSMSRGDGHYLVALGDPGFFWEGIAVLFEKIALRKSFLGDYAEDAKEIDDFMVGVRERLAYRVRRLALSALFEYSLYLDPAPYGKLRSRLGDMLREHIFVEPAVDPPTFTHDIFHITHPCYIQNYVLAEMLASQALDASDSATDDPWTPAFAGRVVDEMLVPGAMVTWREKIEKFTGKPLGSDALVAHLYP